GCGRQQAGIDLLGRARLGVRGMSPVGDRVGPIGASEFRGRDALALLGCQLHSTSAPLLKASRARSYNALAPSSVIASASASERRMIPNGVTITGAPLIALIVVARCSRYITPAPQ